MVECSKTRLPTALSVILHNFQTSITICLEDLKGIVYITTSTTTLDLDSNSNQVSEQVLTKTRVL